jgi:hypothetical protein
VGPARDGDPTHGPNDKRLREMRDGRTSMTTMTNTTCGFGGFCARTAGHMGVHTRSPHPSVRRWDDRKKLLAERRWVLEYLDFPTPDVDGLLDEWA